MRVNQDAAAMRLNRAAMGAAALRNTNGEIAFTEESEIHKVTITIQGRNQDQLVITNCEVGEDHLRRDVFAGKILALLAPNANTANDAANYINNNHVVGVHVSIDFRQAMPQGYFTVANVEARIAQPQPAQAEEETPTA